MVPALFFEERREPRPCSLVSWNPARLPERPFAQGSGLFCGFSRAWSRFTYGGGSGSRRVMLAGREVGGRPLPGAPRPAPGRNAASAWRAGRAVAAVALPGARGERKAGKLRVRAAAGGGAWADAQGRAFHDVHARRGADVSCCRKAAFRAQCPRMGCLLLTCGHKRIS